MLKLHRLALCLVLTGTVLTTSSSAQATATASATSNLELFGGVSKVYTGIQGQNTSFTAGGDFILRRFAGFVPSAEVRGTYAFRKGNIAAEKNILGGIKLTREFGSVHPYVDFLAGRGSINFPNKTYGGSLYEYVSGTVLSPGGGIDFSLDSHWSAKLDFQYQRWGVPVTGSGSIYSRSVTAGVEYRFNFDSLGRRHKKTRDYKD
ncbi:hypothetical protein [Terriglobus albidus]|uniref:hypothetical protein n=1 Tax=Terriglobus albidus TaxID=1592106 RepID=UPI0021E0090C|nr:hypothetical protein [Terriglobus albidus]